LDACGKIIFIAVAIEMFLRKRPVAVLD